MHKYLIKFTKINNMKYISHLDLMNVFQRAFRREGIKLNYSQGFSPHPKMSFAHPLSLGISSIGEYMEAELINKIPENDLIHKLNTAMPKGIGILECKEITGKVKSLAAIVEYAQYKIYFTAHDNINQNLLNEKINKFLNTKEIIAIKKSVKTKKVKEINIRPLIHTFDLISFENKQCEISTIIKTGSNGNLNPELMINSFIDFTDLDIDKESIRIHREELYLSQEEKFISLSSI